MGCDFLRNGRVWDCRSPVVSRALLYSLRSSPWVLTYAPTRHNGHSSLLFPLERRRPRLSSPNHGVGRREFAPFRLAYDPRQMRRGVSQDIACGTASVATLDRKGAATMQPPLPSRLCPWASLPERAKEERTCVERVGCRCVRRTSTPTGWRS